MQPAALRKDVARLTTLRHISWKEPERLEEGPHSGTSRRRRCWRALGSARPPFRVPGGLEAAVHSTVSRVARPARSLSRNCAMTSSVSETASTTVPIALTSGVMPRLIEEKM